MPNQVTSFKLSKLNPKETVQRKYKKLSKLSKEANKAVNKYTKGRKSGRQEICRGKTKCKQLVKPISSFPNQTPFQKSYSKAI